MKLLYYLAAIGNNNLEIKHKILLDNLNYIYNNINEKFSISINFYTISETIKESLKNLYFLENIYIYEKEGVLTELFLTNPNNKTISLYDYILFVFDDIKIINLDIKTMVEIKNKYNVEILSIKIKNSTHNFMNMYPENYLTFNNYLEIYLLFLTPIDFEKFCSIHTIENKWMWGVDFLYGYYQINTAVIHKYIAYHELKNKSNYLEALKLCNNYLKQKTNFKSLNDIKKKYLPVKKFIEL